VHRPCSGQRPVIVNVDCPIVDFQLLELLKCYKRKTVAGVNYTKSINRPIGNCWDITDALKCEKWVSLTTITYQLQWDVIVDSDL